MDRITALINKNGRAMANHYVREGADGNTLISYTTAVAHIDRDGTITLDAENWEYSATTKRAVTYFTGKSLEELRKGIRDNVVRLSNLILQDG